MPLMTKQTGFIMAEKESLHLRICQQKLAEWKSKEKERPKKPPKQKTNQNRLSKNYGETTNHVTYVSQEYQKDKKKKRSTETCEATMTKHFSQINVRHQTTDLRSS